MNERFDCGLTPLFGEECVFNHAPHPISCYGAHLGWSINNLLRCFPILNRCIEEYDCPYYEPIEEGDTK